MQDLPEEGRTKTESESWRIADREEGEGQRQTIRMFARVDSPARHDNEDSAEWRATVREMFLGEIGFVEVYLKPGAWGLSLQSYKGKCVNWNLYLDLDAYYFSEARNHWMSRIERVEDGYIVYWHGGAGSRELNSSHVQLLELDLPGMVEWQGENMLDTLLGI